MCSSPRRVGYRRGDRREQLVQKRTKDAKFGERPATRRHGILPAMQTLREKIGQLIMVGCSAEDLGAAERLVFAEYQFGGYILFKRNCRTPGRILGLCRDLWESAAQTPPFIAIDEEGGSVHRLPAPFTHFPAAAAIGVCGNPDLAYRAGKACAAELALLGINLNFAPVLDVHSNARNPVIGSRAFATAPQTVIAQALAWSRGSRDGGVIPCGKHFPGHGDTDRDSHLEMPIVTKTLAELRQIELPPFIAACRAGIETLMTAHVKFTSLDPQYPATFSAPIVTGLLRQQLGYRGVVFSDDMEMKAVSADFEPGEAAVLALRAGVDVVLLCHDLAKAREAFETLYAAAERDPALRAQVETASRRVAALKQRWLGNFTGVTERELEERLNKLPRETLLAEIQGSL